MASDDEFEEDGGAGGGGSGGDEGGDGDVGDAVDLVSSESSASSASDEEDEAVTGARGEEEAESESDAEQEPRRGRRRGERRPSRVVESEDEDEAEDMKENVEEDENNVVVLDDDDVEAPPTATEELDDDVVWGGTWEAPASSSSSTVAAATTTTTTTTTPKPSKPLPNHKDDEEEDEDSRARKAILSELKSVEDSISRTQEEIDRLSTALTRFATRRDALRGKLDELRSPDGSRDGSWARETFPHSKLLRETLHRVFGFKEFRAMQLQVMNAKMAGRDVFAVLPTGAGKSLLFQLPAVVQGGVTVVVSPLLSLSRDQVLNLAKFNVRAALVCSEQTPHENKRVLDDMYAGALRLVYVTPEMVAASKRFVSVLESLARRGTLTRLVVDEAHCASTMGHDFRPDYQKLFILKRQFPDVPLLCVTATATRAVEADIRRVMLREAGVAEDWVAFRASFNRPNLVFEVHEKRDEGAAFAAQIAALVGHRFNNQCGIVYCHSRKDTEEMAAKLGEAGVAAAAYHAKLGSEDKAGTHDAWRSNAVRVVCATSAFGMGIDKPDVRFVVHATLAKSMEAYVQESGRAGRDGQPATCVLMYRRGDVSRVSSLVSESHGGAAKLLEAVEYAESGGVCRRVTMSKFFGETLDPADACRGACDVCARPAAGVSVPWVVVDHSLHAENLLRCLRAYGGTGVTVTGLVDLWRGAGKVVNPSNVLVAPKKWSRAACERLVMWMLCRRVLGITWQYTAYNTNAYLESGPAAAQLLAQSEDVTVKYMVPAVDVVVSGASSSSKDGKTPKVASGVKKTKGSAVATASKLTFSAASATTPKPTPVTLSLVDDDEVDVEEEDEMDDVVAERENVPVRSQQQQQQQQPRPPPPPQQQQQHQQLKPRPRFVDEDDEDVFRDDYVLKRPRTSRLSLGALPSSSSSAASSSAAVSARAVVSPPPVSVSVPASSSTAVPTAGATTTTTSAPPPPDYWIAHDDVEDEFV